MRATDLRMRSAAETPSLPAGAEGGEGVGGDGTEAKASEGESSTPCCCVYVGTRADISRVTGFKHSALATLAIVRRPPSSRMPLAHWLPTLRPMGGANSGAPLLLLMDNVIKPDNVGGLFRTALAFGVSGVLLSPKCADPLYRKVRL